MSIQAVLEAATMKADAELNLDSLIDAYLAKNKYRNAHEDLRGYHEKRLQILQSLFGCDLEKRQAELDAQAQAMKKKGVVKERKVLRYRR
jgi:hypothetical protein